MLPQDLTSGHVGQTRAEQISAEQGQSEWQENMAKEQDHPHSLWKEDFLFSRPLHVYPCKMQAKHCMGYPGAFQTFPGTFPSSQPVFGDQCHMHIHVQGGRREKASLLPRETVEVKKAQISSWQYFSMGIRGELFPILLKIMVPKYKELQESMDTAHITRTCFRLVPEQVFTPLAHYVKRVKPSSSNKPKKSILICWRGLFSLDHWLHTFMQKIIPAIKLWVWIAINYWLENLC